MADCFGMCDPFDTYCRYGRPYLHDCAYATFGYDLEDYGY